MRARFACEARRARGFTIIEILVVISVIAILAGIAIPKFKGMQDQGKIEKVKSELKTIQTALESYYIHHSSYPDKATYMADLVGATPQMISAALVDPFASNGSDYYQYSKNGRNYAVWSVGLDRVGATADIDASGNVSPGGDDILVTNGTIGAGGGGGGDQGGGGPAPVACTSFTYSAWGACADSSQTRTVTVSSPDGCSGGSPVLTQSCTADPCDAGSNPQPGTECADHSIYVNASLRTTAGDAGTFAWIDCAACGRSQNGGCYDDDWNWVCSGGEPNPAAQACVSLGAGWHLPSQGELDQLFQVSNCKSANSNCDDAGAVVGGFVADYYWSSTEYDSGSAWYQIFNNGSQNFNGKDYSGNVRCVRSP